MVSYRLKKDNLNKSIANIVSNLQPGEFSKPIRASSGFIMIKLEEEKDQVLEFNLDNKIDEVIRFKRNEQLNQFSSII